VELAPHVEAIRDDVASLLAGEEGALDALERLQRAVEASVQLRLLDAVGEAAQELSTQLTAGHVDVRIAGRDVQLVFVDAPESPAAAPDEDEAGTARLTLRMPESLKGKVESAAAHEGLSVNAWLVRTISRGLTTETISATIRSGRSGRSGRRITGYAQG
jgi:predicted HicB family RNase H-like nuclease